MMDPAIQSDEKRDEAGRFIVPPVSPGRPKGSRNKLGEAFLSALHDDFNEHGVQAIQMARLESPIQYVKVIASLLPTEHKFTFADQYNEMTDAELADRARQLAAAIAPLLADGTGDAEQGASGTGGEVFASRVH